MDFIERWFGMSPDGGTGIYEALLLLIPVGAAAMVIAWRRRRRRPRSAS